MSKNNAQAKYFNPPEYPKRKRNGAPRFESIEESLAWWMFHQRRVIGIGQEQVAKRLGISRATYGTYESGKRTPSLKQFIQICNALYIPYQSVIDDADWEL